MKALFEAETLKKLAIAVPNGDCNENILGAYPSANADTHIRIIVAAF